MADKRDDAYNLRKLFEEMELDLVRSMRRNLKRHEKEQEKEGFKWEMWQKAKLRNLQQYRRDNKDLLGEISPEVERIVNEALQDNYEKGQGLFTRVFQKIKSLFTKKKRVDFPKDISHHKLSTPAPKENNFFGMNENKLDALQSEAEKPRKQEPEVPEQKLPEKEKAQDAPEQKPDARAQKQPDKKEEPLQQEEPFKPEGKEKELTGSTQDKKLDDMTNQVTHDLQEAQKAILRRMDDVYRQVIYRAEMHMAAGAKTLDQAIDMATKEFLEKGIDCIEYKNGRRANIASYAEMCLRTASQRATLLGEGKKRDEWGIHTVVVTAHANTCPLCAPWQGKVLIDDVFSHGTQEEAERLGYPLLSTAMRAGLLHPNCRHTISTFFPGITKTPNIPDTEKALETYKAEQEQRAIEREIKKWKRKAEGACDPDNVAFANRKVKEAQDRLKVHLDKHPELRREPSREKTRGVGTIEERLAKVTDMMEDYNNGQKDVINHVSIFKNLKKSPIGKEILEYFSEHPEISISICYNIDHPKDVLGQQIGNNIYVYASETKTIQRTAEILIHEATHHRYNVGGSQWAEGVCRAQELKHRYKRNELTGAELRNIIKSIKNDYPNMEWR